MTSYAIDDSEFAALKGKTVLITGASTGIGRATVYLAHQYGANLIIGDVLEKEGQELARELGDRVIFRKCDVSLWDDVLELFQVGFQKFGALDVVLANAGVNEIGNMLEDKVDGSTGRLLPPNLATLNINLLGVIYTAKCAIHYFAKMGGKPCQLVLTGSAACFLDTAPLYVYSASKTGVMGLMRSLRTQLPKNSNTTINMVAPWMTKTPMLLPNFLRVWGELPANEPIGVARALLLPAVRTELNGKSLFIAGHDIVDLEEGLERTKPEWMGKELSDHVDEGQRRILP
ncbi:5'-hydroxyaverantin dehydrogenase [Lachnellula willkommii]|uniref:5'-hydroxyaverantin dehydrogenase n=1 Tax=Lachnellula willkommii TaxID=215461 RepID=A0A559M4A1_9HELO|nr:5'-hydroxyaverantin dehydrogenase [Lachnellula willkommii]